MLRMLNNEPMVSVLMTAYNREKYIAEAIESVLSSTYKNFELIIVDDASKDRTLELANLYASKNHNICVHSNKINLGDYGNRNRAASYAQGEFIMFVDSDDTIYPDGIENCVKAMINHPKADFGMFYRTNEMISPFYWDASTAINNHFFKNPFLLIGPGGTIFKRSFFYRINNYPTKYGPANDMYFNLKAASTKGVLLLPFEFVNYRIHEGQEINNKFSYLYNTYQYFDDALKELQLPLTTAQIKWLSKKNKRRFVTNITNYFITTGNLSNTFKAIRKTNFGMKDFITGVFH